MRNLKKISAISAILMLSVLNFSSLKAQYQVVNSGFETFETGWNGEGQQPTGWKGSNVKVTTLGVTVKTTLVTSAAGRTGNCVYLHNEMSGAAGIEAPAYAYISLGQPWVEVYGLSEAKSCGGTTGGINFIYRPDTLSIWVKRTYTSFENARVLIYLWSGNAVGTSYKSKGDGCHSITQTNDVYDILNTNSCTTTTLANLIGKGEEIITQQYQNWTQIKVPITYFNNDVPQKMNIVISAANYPAEGQSNSIKEGSKLWADDLSLIYSSKIHELRVFKNGVFFPIQNFNPNTLSYIYTLPQGTTTIPDIQAFRSGRQLSGSEFQITSPGVVDVSPTVVKVTAQDGSSTTTYSIQFVTTQSTNAFPANILVNGTPINNFNPNIFTYNVSLPYGTTTCPTITVQKAEETQTYTISNCTNVPGTATVKVFAQDVSVSKTYTINFTVAPLNDNTLQNILINGTGIQNFNPTNNSYTIELPLGTTQAPTITPISAYANGVQTIVQTNGGLTGTTTIKVSSPASTVRTYSIKFEITISSYAYLNGIQIGGTPLAGFNAETLNYNYLLPRETTVLPQITWTLGEPNQTVALTTNGVNGEARITVTAHNGNIKIYRINFSVERSEDTFLNDILLNGISISNFHSDTLSYNIELPSGTTTLPSIAYVLGDYAQTVIVTTNGLNGTTTIRVTAENPQFYRIYKLNFSVTLSASSQLEAILVDGEMLDGFSPEILNYNYTLPATATQCPDIEVIKAAAGQQVFIVKPALTGIATIKVISEILGGGENIYTINFHFELSEDNFLDWIKINGTSVAGFNSTTTSYTVTLPSGSTAPTVEYFAHDPEANVFVVNNGLNGTLITVTAQNGATLTYSITYNTLPTNNVNLANIEIWDNSAQNFVSLADFDAQNTDYQYNLAWRTNLVPAINPVPAESGQVITIFYDVVNETTEIQVVAPNGTDQKTYKIYFPVAKSNNCTLNTITVNGAEMQDLPPFTAFDPQTLTYSVILPYGTNQMPEVAFEKGKEGNSTVFEQQIEITEGNINEPYMLKVIAEDGTTQTYTLNFSIDMSSMAEQNYLNNILVGGVPVSGFDSEMLDYSVVLPYGTTNLPELFFDKKYPEQTVVTDVSGVWGVTKIKVFSNISGTDLIEYTINFSVSDVPTTTLNSVSFNDVVFSNFDPKVYSYIVPVTAQPTVLYTYNENELLVNETFSNHKKLVLEVSDLNNEDDKNYYTFWYYYTNDIIPNASFENWSNTVYNSKQKPTGWNAPADAFDKITAALFFTYTSGDEVSRTTDRRDGAYGALLQGCYVTPSTQGFPGMMTLGNVQSSGNTASTHVSSVNGGINFRNTPDAFGFDYKWEQNLVTASNPEKNTNMRALIQLWNTGTNYSAGEKVVENLYTGSSTSWVTISRSLVYNENNMYPKRMNITLNASNSENTADLYPYGIPVSNKWGKMWVDKLVLGYNSTLSNIYVNGVSVPGFNGSINGSSYTMNIPAGTMAPPVITFANAVPDQEVRITMSSENASRQRTVQILSTAEDNTTKTAYTLILNRPVANITTLAGIFANGVSVPDFNASTLIYNVSVPNGTIFSPDIFVIKGEGHQNISYSFGEKQISILVTAENGNQQTYTVNFIEQTSDDATLLNLEVVDYEINFDAQTTEYQVILPAGTQDIPKIIFTKQSNGQTVILTTCPVNGTATVRVAAEDSVHFADYSVVFSTAPVATSHLLSEISIGNLPISNFVSTTFDYIVDNGKIIFTKEYAEDTITTVYFADSIKCFIGENIYKIVFENNNFDNAYLENIFVNGLSLSDFLSTQLVYNEDWDENNLPDIEVISGAEGQTITSVWGENTITILVVAPDGITQNEYVINFVSSDLSPNSLLADILINGFSIDNFIPTEFGYSVVLPEGTLEIPVIQAVKGEDHQTVSMTTSGQDVIITVTAQDGTISTYTVNITVILSDNALLTAIFIGGILIDDFDSNTFDYGYVLPYGTTTLPDVEYTKGHPNQTVTVQSNGVNGDYIITVTSESGLFTNQYIISFETALSSNAYLENILVNSVEIEDFIFDLFEYKIELPCGTTEVPTITWEINENQTVIATYAETVNDTTTLLVTAQNGINQNLYKIYFDVKQSTNVLLTDIIIGGESLSTPANGYVTDNLFEAEQFEYTVTLPYGTTALPAGLPEISATGQGAETCFTINIEQENDSTIIIDVTSLNGNVNTYSLNFKIALSNNSKLEDILINGVSLDNFHSDTLYYEIIYPIGTQENELLDIEDISYILGDSNQDVVVSIDDSHRIVIIVTAQDGSQTVYVIEQIILKSDNALLADIVIDGKSISDFEPTKFHYEYLLPFGASAIPTYIGVKQEDSQSINYTQNHVEETSYIFVTAEDGSENVYSILFSATGKNPGDKPTKDDVCWSYYADGTFKFSSSRNNVTIFIYDTAGRLIYKAGVPVSDPNSTICDSENGAMFRATKKGQVYVFSFVYNLKQKITSGKFLY